MLTFARAHRVVRGGDMRLLKQITFLWWFQALYGPRMQLWCFRVISECSECQCHSFKTFWRTPIYIGGGLIPKMAVLSGWPQVVFIQIGSSLTSKFQNLSSDTRCTGMNVKVWNTRNKDQVPQEKQTPNTHSHTLHTHYHNLGARVRGLWYWKISLVS